MIALYAESDHPSERVGISFKILESTGSTNTDITIFTDGSKTEKGVGAAFCVFDKNQLVATKKLKLASYCSVFQAELYAIYSTFIWLKTFKKIYKSLSIVSDSYSSLMALEDRSSNILLCKSIQRELADVCSKDVCVKFFWTKAHADQPGNELADKLAKEACESHLSFAYDQCPLSYVKRFLYEETIRKWNEQWRSSSKGRTTAEFFPDIRSRLSCRHLSLGFIQTQFLSGHGKFKEYLHRFNRSTTDACICSITTQQTPNHLLTSCPCFAEIRFALESEAGFQDIELTFQTLVSNKNLFQLFTKATHRIHATLKRLEEEETIHLQ